MKIESGMKIVATNTHYSNNVPNGTIMTVVSDWGDGHVHATVDGGDGLDWFMEYGTYEPYVAPAADTTTDNTPTDDAPKLWRDMTPAEKGALLLAHHEGKVIEELSRVTDWWQDTGPDFPKSSYAYRVKPEPREFWVDPERCIAVQAYHAGFVHVREVLE